MRQNRCASKTEDGGIGVDSQFRRGFFSIHPASRCMHYRQTPFLLHRLEQQSLFSSHFDFFAPQEAQAG